MTTAPTASTPAARNLHRMEERLRAADDRIAHLDQLLTAADRAADRYRGQRDLHAAALTDIAELLTAAPDRDLRAEIAKVLVVARAATAEVGRRQQPARPPRPEPAEAPPAPPAPRSASCWRCQLTDPNNPVAAVARDAVAFRFDGDDDTLIGSVDEMLAEPTCPNPHPDGGEPPRASYPELPGDAGVLTFIRWLFAMRRHPAPTRKVTRR